MSRRKRTFSLVLALALILGALGALVPAFARKADAQGLNMFPADVIGTDYEESVKRLVAFGLIEGYPDGTYRPEVEVNRAEFTKLLIYALGLEDGAAALQGQSTGFSDVDGKHWASGYIKIAGGQDLIKGYPDGSFRPDEKVTYAQTVTMLVRALGYKDEFLPGDWPGNYTSKAIDEGITRGLRLPGQSAEGSKRGLVAQLIDNTLNAKVIVAGGYIGDSGVAYSETGESLLKSRLKISKYQDTRVIGDKFLDDDLGKSQVRIRFLQDVDKNNNKEVKNSYKKDESQVFDSKFDVRSLIGEEVTSYLTDKDEVLYVERENDDKVNFDYVEEVKGEEVSLVQFHRSYKFADSADVYLANKDKDQFELYSGKNLKESDLLGKMGKFVVEGNQIVFAEVMNPTEVVVVLENQEGLLEGINNLNENFKLDLRENQNYDYSLVYNTKGEKMGLGDIREGNLIYLQKLNYGGDEIALVRLVEDNRVQGTLEDIQMDKLKIGGKTLEPIKAGSVYKSYYKVDEYQGVKAWGASSWRRDMDDVDKKEAVAYTDGVGRLAFLNVKDADSDYKFGVVTRTYADGDRVQIFTSLDGEKGKDTIFKAESRTDLSVKQKLVGSAVKFRLNADGEIAKGKFEVKPYGSALKMAKNENFGRDIIKASNGNSYAVTSDMLTIINAPKLQDKAPVDLKANYGDLQGESYGGAEEVDTSAFSRGTWEEFKGMKYDRGVEFYLFTKDGGRNEVEALVFIGEGSSDEVALYALNQWRRGSETLIEYVSYPEKKTQTRVLQEVKGQKGELEEKAYIGEEKATGELVLYYAIPSTEAQYFDLTIIRNAKINKISGNFIEISEEGKTTTQDIDMEGSLVYQEKSLKSTYSLKQGDIVDIIKEGHRARIINLVK